MTQVSGASEAAKAAVRPECRPHPGTPGAEQAFWNPLPVARREIRVVDCWKASGITT